MCGLANTITPVRMWPKDFATELEKLEVFATYHKWFTAKLKEATEQDKFLAAVDLPLAQAIVKTLSVQFENGGKCFFEKKLLLQKEQRVCGVKLFSRSKPVLKGLTTTTTTTTPSRSALKCLIIKSNH